MYVYVLEVYTPEHIEVYIYSIMSYHIITVFNAINHIIPGRFYSFILSCILETLDLTARCWIICSGPCRGHWTQQEIALTRLACCFRLRLYETACMHALHDGVDVECACAGSLLLLHAFAHGDHALN